MHIGLFVKDFAVGKKFAKNGLPNKSGAEFHAENHANQLIQRGNCVTIMAKKRYWFTKAREMIDGIDLVRLHNPVRWLEILVRLCTTHRDIDAFYIIGAPKFSVWVILYARCTGKPVTLALTGKAEIFRAADGWRNKILARCDHYIATTEEIRRGFMEQGGIAPERITVLAHGIDVRRYPYCPPGQRRKNKAAYRLTEKNGNPGMYGAHAPQARLNAGTKVLLFCARIVLNKGVDTLQRIWPIVHAVDPSARLFVVGGGRHELLADLRRMGEETDGSVIVTGEVDRPQEYYQLADVYVFPSRHEGLPTSLLEAMSSGLPSVASDIGGCDDLIFDYETGFRVDAEDAEGFAEKILYLFRHEPDGQEMGKNASRFVEEHCDYRRVIGKLEGIIRGKQAQ